MAAHPQTARATPAPQRRRAGARSKSQAVARLSAAWSELAEGATLDELNQLAVQAERAAAARDDDPGVSPLTGEARPSDAEYQQVRLRNLQRAFGERRRLLQDTVTATQVAELLGTGRQTPHDRLKAQTLVAIKDGGQWRFPLWQFDPNGPDGTVRGLPEVLHALRGPLSDLGRLQWFVTAKPLLGDRSPLDALHDGDVPDVIAEARAAGAA
jgi:hypothetical protein